MNRLFVTVLLMSACNGGDDDPKTTTSADTDTDTDADTDSDTDTDTDADTDSDTDTDTDTDTEPLPLPFTGLSVFQVVEVPLADDLGEILPSARNVPLVADRDAWVAVWPDVPAGWVSATVDAELEVTTGGVTHTYAVSATVDGDADPTDPEQALLIAIPAADMQPDTTYAVSLSSAGTALGRFPTAGDAELAPEVTDTLKIHLVPYVANGFEPDTSPAVVEGYRDAVMALYPTTEVILTVGDPRPWPNNDVGDILVDVGIVQEQIDRAPKDVYYFGLVSGVATRAEFQGSTGTSEGGIDPFPERAYFGVGAAFGDDLSFSTLTHELGHMMGLEHSPCGNPPNVNTSYPYADGSTGTWGFDMRTETFLPPTTNDVMGYCQPRWVGDYHYDLLVDQMQRARSF